MKKAKTKIKISRHHKTITGHCANGIFSALPVIFAYGNPAKKADAGSVDTSSWHHYDPLSLFVPPESAEVALKRARLNFAHAAAAKQPKAAAIAFSLGKLNLVVYYALGGQP
jgi:hypothetical protein